MLAQKQAMRILADKAIELIPERYPGYRADAVRKLRAVIDAQAGAENDTKRHTEVLAQLDALAAVVGTKRSQS